MPAVADDTGTGGSKVDRIRTSGSLRAARSIVPGMTCESCGAEGQELQPVHRKYVSPAAWDQVPAEQVLPDVERWCFACLTHYPHEPA